MQHADNCRHTHGCCAAECAGGCDCEDLGIIQCGNVQLFRGDGHILLCLCTGDLIGDNDIHRSGDRCRAADADARCIGADELHRVRRQCYIAVCLNPCAFAKLCHGAAVKPCDHCHRGDSRAAGTCNGCCHVEKVGAALRRHIHIALGSHAAAKACKQVIFKSQCTCAHAHSRAAAACEAESQQVHFVRRLCRCLDAPACAHASAGTHACLHSLIIDHGHNCGAYACAATGRNTAGKVIYLCFV